jgi:hypothetical protein
VRSDVVKGRGYGAVAIAVLLLLLAGCARPKGIQAAPTLQPSPTPVAAHAPLTISNPVFHSGEVGVTFAPVTLSATGGVAPYTWSVPVGALPGGLTLSSDGVVSGTPTANGYFSFAVQVLDFGGNDTAGVPGTIPIVPRLTASLVSACATECTVELGCVSVCGTFGQVGGGAAPLKYTLTSGPLPAGTTLNGLSLNGTFIGLPGRLQFTVQVTDGFGATGLITARYNLIPHISFPGGSVTCFYPGCDGKYYPTKQLPYTGGVGSPSVRVTNWAVTCDYPPCGPPPAPAVSASGGYVSIAVPGSAGGSGYKAVLTLMLTDQAPCGAGSNCSTAGTVNVVVQSG